MMDGSEFSMVMVVVAKKSQFRSVQVNGETNTASLRYLD